LIPVNQAAIYTSAITRRLHIADIHFGYLHRLPKPYATHTPSFLVSAGSCRGFWSDERRRPFRKPCRGFSFTAG
jgi:hypothetical protein